MKNKLLPIQLLILASFIVFSLFMWQGNKGFNLWDEGFLWYGAQRVMLGEVPIRDFMAYDPGRYYWSAAFMNVLGDNGIMTLRMAVAIFQMIGLFVGLLLIALTTKKQNFFYLLLSAVTLVVWMFPRHKLFDISLSIFLIGALAFLIQKPTNGRYFFTGLSVGLVALFGRNHGVYGVIGSLGVMTWLKIKSESNPTFIRGIVLWASGILVGFMPLLFMMLMVPGFAIAFWESISFLFESKSTNLPLPIPWPWKVSFVSTPLDIAIQKVLFGLFFIGLVIFGILAPLWVVKQKLHEKNVPPTLVAAAFLTLPYAHYAYSRADIGHLALGIFPLLIGCLTLLAIQSTKIKWSLGCMLCVASLWVVYNHHPGWDYQREKNSYVNVEISGNNLLVDLATAKDIELIRDLTLKFAPHNQNFIVAPVWPGAYSLLECKSPMWEIYALFPRSPAFEQAELERIKSAKPAFVFIFDHPLDERDELRFQNTHPVIHQYVRDNFEQVPYPTNSSYLIYTAKENQPKLMSTGPTK